MKRREWLTIAGGVAAGARHPYFGLTGQRRYK